MPTAIRICCSASRRDPPDRCLRFYRNDGGRFTDQTSTAGLVVPTGAVRQPAWVDVGRRRRSRSVRRVPRSAQCAVPQRARHLHRRRVDARPRRSAQDGRRRVVRLRRGRRSRPGGRQHGRRRQRACSATTAAASSTWPTRPASPGVAGRRATPATARSGSVPPTWTATAVSTSLAANYGPLGYFVNRGQGRFDDRAAASGLASTAATTPVPPPTSITTAGSIST